MELGGAGLGMLRNRGSCQYRLIPDGSGESLGVGCLDDASPTSPAHNWPEAAGYSGCAGASLSGLPLARLALPGVPGCAQ